MIAAARAVRGYAEKGDEMALRIFEQQAKAIGRMFSIAANFTTLTPISSEAESSRLNPIFAIGAWT